MGEEVEITTKRPVPLPLCPPRSLCIPSVPLPPCLSPHLGLCFYSAMENCLDLAIRTGGAAGSDAPTQTLIRLIRRTGRPADTLVYKSHTHAYVCILRKGCPPVRLVTLYLLYSSNFGAKIGIKKRVSNFGTRLGMTVLFRY